MKIICTFLISLIPINKVKIFLYRIFFGYKISGHSKIGFFNVICSEELNCDGAKIGNFNYIKCAFLTLKKGASINKFNRLKNINKLELKKEAMIFSWNFISGIPKGSSHHALEFNNQNICLGENSALLRKNYIDLVDEITIGSNVVFGGNGSEIWTHGFDTKRNFLKGKVSFGNNIFVGSKCIFTKGISIADETSFASGSVIYKSILERGTYSTHQLRKIK